MSGQLLLKWSETGHGVLFLIVALFSVNRYCNFLPVCPTYTELQLVQVMA